MHSHTIIRAAVAGLAAAALIATAGCAGNATPAAASGSPQAGGNQAQAAAFAADATTPPSAPTASGMHTISVSATGTATGTPDILTVQLGVQTQAATAGEALKDNNTRANKLIETLAGQGVEKKDISTSDLSIYPNYSTNGNSITGYQVSNMVTVTLRDIAKSGSVIDAAGAAVGDAIRLNQVSFSFSDSSELKATARTDAVKKALAQAKQLADAAGVAVGPIVSISEDTSFSQPMPMYAAADSAASGESMPVVAGDATLAVTVQVIVSIG